MDIDQFQEEITKNVVYRDGNGRVMSSEELCIYLRWDGCLSATFRGEDIPCETESWADSLQVIADTVKAWNHIE